MKYTFGTNTTAASRLEEISKFFNPLAGDIIRKNVSLTPEIAIDLGCGPGFTTKMVAESTQAKNVYGYDNSEEFLTFAETQYPKYTFIRHDITDIPFPYKADFMYCRFLLSHLKDPVNLINKWLTQLTDKGMLFIDELDHIESGNEIFNIYLSTNDALIKSQGADLYVGNSISRGKYVAGVIMNECHKLPVADCLAAEWFYPNTVSVWRNNPVIAALLSRARIEAISGILNEIMNLRSDQSSITWYMRRILSCSRSTILE